LHTIYHCSYDYTLVEQFLTSKICPNLDACRLTSATPTERGIFDKYHRGYVETFRQALAHKRPVQIEQEKLNLRLWLRQWLDADFPPSASFTAKEEL
jgi:hypothetical protein